ncbi:murein transglycosylase A [Cohaesibacter intestini]|uniref:murein transglycosylase A n=1 Tax=Cohaesibacter intestini TaxID=2211145 RepID=UPI000DE9126C|nr:MltA domain-containing protein [Cohaesibacter intestini]
MMAGLTRTDFATLSGWADHDHEVAFAAFRHSAPFLIAHPPTSRHPSVAIKALLAVAQAALDLPADLPGPHARLFFERHFAPYSIDGEGLLTGYYEPEFDARLAPDTEFRFPLHRRPHDLVSLKTKEALAAGFTPETSFARQRNGKIELHLSRAAIMAGGLEGQGLEFVWLKDPFEAYIIHIQGSARLRLEDGQTMRVAFDGKSGHPYQSLGKLLIEEGHFTPDSISMGALIAHLRAMGAEGVAYLGRNPSYIFFKPVEEPALNRAETGPLSAAHVPLLPLRSIAVDRHLHTFGLPFWIETMLPSLEQGDETPFRQLVLAHDTGSAIKGMARADLFCGSGETAGQLAGILKQPTCFTCLLPLDEKEQADG